MLFIEKSGIDIASRFQGYGRREVKSLGQFVLGLQDCLLTNVKKMFIEVSVYINFIYYIQYRVGQICLSGLQQRRLTRQYMINEFFSIAIKKKFCAFKQIFLVSPKVLSYDKREI